MPIPLLPDNPHVRDLIGVAVYAAGIVLIAAAVFAGIRFAAPVAAERTVWLSHALDRWSDGDPDDDLRHTSNFERWRANREAASHTAHQGMTHAAAEESRPPAEPRFQLTGIAAAAKAKALAEMGRGEDVQRRAVDRDRSAAGARDDASPPGPRDEASPRAARDVALPPGAQPAEQMGFTPPPAYDKHRVY